MYCYFISIIKKIGLKAYRLSHVFETWTFSCTIKTTFTSWSSIDSNLGQKFISRRLITSCTHMLYCQKILCQVGHINNSETILPSEINLSMQCNQYMLSMILLQFTCYMLWSWHLWLKSQLDLVLVKLSFTTLYIAWSSTDYCIKLIQFFNETS